MSFFPTIVSNEEFTRTCRNFRQFSTIPYLEIAGDEQPYHLQIVTEISLLDTCLRVFGYKPPGRRLNEVAHFALNWLRAHSYEYIHTFKKQLRNIVTIRPLMVKAKLKSEFDKVTRFVTNAYKLGKLEKRTQITHLECLAALELMQSRAEQAYKEASELQKLYRLRMNLDAYALTWPKDLPIDEKIKQDIESKLNEIIKIFISNPGTLITRPHGSKTLHVNIPTKSPLSFELPLEVDCYFSQEQRRIIVYPATDVDPFAKSIEQTCFDLIKGQCCVSLHREHNELAITEFFHRHKLFGLPTYFARRDDHIIEATTKPLREYLHHPRTFRLKFMEQLLLALRNLHDIVLTQKRFEESTSGAMTMKSFEFPAFHGNLTLESIGIENDDQAVISNLKEISQTYRLSCPSGFTSPEKHRFSQGEWGGLRPRGVIEHNIECGRAADVFSLGLILIAIAFKRRVAIPERAYGCSLNKQQDMNEMISTEIESKCSKEFKPFWPLIMRMLTLDPSARCTAKEAYEEFHSIRASKT